MAQELHKDTESSRSAFALGRAGGLELAEGLVWGQGKCLSVVAIC